jgi:tetratricopeptide (TPR) repeat protein
MKNIREVVQESLTLEKANRYSDALAFINTARRAQPQARPLAIRQAQLLEATKQYEQAHALYRQLHESKQDAPEAEVLIGIGRCLVKLKHYEQGAKLLKQLQEKIPPNPAVLTSMATCLRQKNKLDDAKQLVTEALKISSDNKEARMELAEIQVAEQQDEEAIATIEANVLREDLHGDSIDLWLGILKRLGRDRYTQEKLEAMVKRYPKKVEFVFGLGVVAHRSGEIPIARPALQKADQLHPNNPRILHELGVLERTAGNIDLSQQLLGRALEIQPEQPAALRTFGNEHKYTYGDEAFTRLNYSAARLADVEPIEQVHLHYALAKAFEDVGELDTAFRHYETAGVKKRKLEPYSERGSARMFQVMPKLVNRKTINAKKQEGCPSEQPVFILGMPRSGTSLLEQILSSHPDIYGAGELKFITGVVDNIEVGEARVILNEKEPVFPHEENASWKARGERYVEKLEKLAGKPYKRIVDKMPGNFTMLGLIHAILPNAKIIHSRRHPVETCLSNYRIHFAEGQLWSYNQRELGRYYRRYWELMKHWREEFPESMLEVRYEDNVADVEGQARKIIDYLGLAWDENCLNFYNTDRPVKTASVTQVRKPIYKTSTNRWRKYEKYLGPLLDELGDIVPQYEAEIAHLIEK